MQSQAPARAPRYVPALDGMRAVAVVTVLLAHGSVRMMGAEGRWATGGLGVQVFFVLSGYLITSLLLAEHHRFGRISLKDFYARRALRIWPLYYAVLLVYVLVLPHVSSSTLGGIHVASSQPAFEGYRAQWWAYFVFLQNYTADAQQVRLGLGLLWSLAVEEQYYVIWPLALIGLLRLRHRYAVPAALLAALATVTVLRVLTLEGHLPEPTDVEFMLHTGGTGLICGSLLAWARDQQQHRVRSRGDGLPGYVLAWLVLALLTAVKMPDSATFGLTFAIANLDYVEPLLIAFATATIIDRLVSVPSSGRLLSTPVLTYLGRISYGMYLLHPLVRWVPRALLDGSAEDRTGWLGMAIFALATVAVATLAHYALERPVLRLKSRFQRVEQPLQREPAEPMGELSPPPPAPATTPGRGDRPDPQPPR